MKIKFIFFIDIKRKIPQEKANEWKRSICENSLIVYISLHFIIAKKGVS